MRSCMALERGTRCGFRASLPLRALPSPPHLPQSLPPPLLLLLLLTSLSFLHHSNDERRMYFIDVVKSRLQTDGLPSQPSLRKYSGALDCAKRLYAENGWRGFTRGLTPTLIR